MRVRIGCCYNNNKNINNYNWLIILLVFGTSIISVAPDSSTTVTRIFQQANMSPSTVTRKYIFDNFIDSSVNTIHSSSNNNSINYNKYKMNNSLEYMFSNNKSRKFLKYINNSTTVISSSISSKFWLKNNNNKYNTKNQKFDLIYPKRTKSFLTRYKRDGDVADELLNPDPCYQFTHGDPETKTFYSPGFPDNYPKKINCTKRIEAPEGYQIRLDFRDTFKIEDKEDCKFDYLEIRDGPYGFSTLLGNYCGETFPPEIISKERHLWLFFHSDESIEYSGFTAVYEFKNRPADAISTDLNCIIPLEGYEGWVNHSQIPDYVKNNVTKYQIPLDCMWVITVKEGWKIQTKFREFNLDKPNDCLLNFLDFFNEETTMGTRLKNFCGSAGESLQSDKNKMHIRFYAEHAQVEKSKFEIVFTAFREKKEGCVEDEYDCEDSTCIAKELLCNGRTNCKFNWDEDNCNPETSSLSEHVVIIIIIFGLILGGMIATFLFNCIRKLVRDQKIIREHIRQSKESKLDDINSIKRSEANLSIKLSPREKHSQTSLQILDDVSNRFYRDMPIFVQNSHSDSKPPIDGNGTGKIPTDTILRQQHDVVVQTSLCGDDSSSSIPTTDNGGNVGGNMCDTGCQTRESLFHTPSSSTLVRQKSSASPQQSQGALRFSTFGYDQQHLPKSKTLSRQSTYNTQKQQSIEMEDLRHHQVFQQQHRPSEICQHHHQHQMHHQQQQLQQLHHPTLPHFRQTMIVPQHQQTNNGTGSSSGSGPTNNKNTKQKMDESKLLIDIRNSAPDVIIMTSH